MNRLRPLVAAVVGASHQDSLLESLAEQVGTELARRGIMLVCGGLGGVMAAACRGAKATGGQTLGILPGRDPSVANPWVDVAIATGMGEARNCVIIHTAQVVIAVGGEYGTLSEIALALKLGKPVIGLQTWELGKGGETIGAIQVVDTPLVAVELAQELLKQGA